jgi:predicted phosphodiesterase
MGLLQSLGLRRQIVWDNPTVLDQFLDSPLQAIVLHLYLIILWLRGNPVKPPPNKEPIRVVCLSDTHDLIVQDVPDGDLLIHAGDLTNAGTAHDIQKQLDWLASLPHRHKVVVCGNHDSYFDIKSRKEEDQLSGKKLDYKDLHYLQNKPLTLNFKGGRRMNLYGAPNLPQCGDSSNAFQYLPQDHPWTNTIPLGTDILVTHAPPKYHLDLDLGCAGMLQEVWRVKPKLHVFGHVHCGRGTQPVFWDDCQKAYESLAARGKHGFLYDMLPTGRWIDALKVLGYGTLSVVWQFVMLGGSTDGGLMVNAGCQEGNTKRLTKKKPFVVEI